MFQISSHDEYDAKAATVGVLREQNEDLRSLKELIMYCLKGMAAYLEHAMRLGHNDEVNSSRCFHQAFP